MEGYKEVRKIASLAKEASVKLRDVSADQKDKILNKMATFLIKNEEEIIKANRKDIRKARRHNKSPSFIDRLTLNHQRIEKMAACLREISQLQNPIGEIISTYLRPNGLRIIKTRVPIGVIGVIYESRPNVTSDCIGLCLKTQNALILRGGSFAYFSNLAIFKILNDVAINSGIPEGAINMIKTTDRKAIKILLKQDRFIDLIIPRGGESLIKEVTRNSSIPVIKHYKGLCHIYVDEFADLNMAHNIVLNAKVQRPSVCNAVETLLVHKDIAVRFLPLLIKALKRENVEVRGCRMTQKIVKEIKRANKKDWQTEYLDKIISIKVVGDEYEAIGHINRYSSGLSEVIVTDNLQNAKLFLEKVDSAVVYLNASSRFTDGNQFGLGAEIGISTDKIHARGPMSVNELTTYKYIVIGEGQIRTS
ncbi:MAG TPA: glutamate-5-semialdehyde dehydrogenase [Candidatus Omnitrophica bacterium]|nr:glutamate-5-semialdehyde dehydrogenase [Candidatus Omnitrophota bacterium]